MPDCGPRRPSREAGLHRQRLEVLAFATDDALKEATKRSKAIGKLTGQADKARPKIEASLRLAEEQQDRRGRSPAVHGAAGKDHRAGRSTAAR